MHPPGWETSDLFNSVLLLQMYSSQCICCPFSPATYSFSDPSNPMQSLQVPKLPSACAGKQQCVHFSSKKLTPVSGYDDSSLQVSPKSLEYVNTLEIFPYKILIFSFVQNAGFHWGIFWGLWFFKIKIIILLMAGEAATFSFLSFFWSTVCQPLPENQPDGEQRWPRSQEDSGWWLCSKASEEATLWCGRAGWSWWQVCDNSSSKFKLESTATNQAYLT